MESIGTNRELLKFKPSFYSFTYIDDEFSTGEIDRKEFKPRVCSLETRYRQLQNVDDIRYSRERMHDQGQTWTLKCAHRAVSVIYTRTR